MQPKGNVLLKKEFVHTKRWPEPQFTLNGIVDLEKEYKEALSGKMVTVMDVAFDKSSYLVLGETKDGGAFIWDIDARDTMDGSFLPLIKKNGIVMPAGLSPMEEVVFLAKHMDHYTKK